jgi:hypothetical protein
MDAWPIVLLKFFFKKIAIKFVRIKTAPIFAIPNGESATEKAVLKQKGV